jgi:hypothetical protein
MDFKKVKLQGKGGKRQLKTETKKAKKSSYWSFFLFIRPFSPFSVSAFIAFPSFFLFGSFIALPFPLCFYLCWDKKD